ncbi:MAG: hypothetical protein KC729_15180, partial [Candidatus Eisenbacteria bacterium]|nr:hypothetical protein [Candidatus Eisenbacteria bacterium]
QGVVIGAAGSSESAPTLGDRVWIGPHAVVTGPIRVGSDVVIGANSLVAAPLADRAVAVGVPARVLTYGGSARLIKVPPTLRQRWQAARPAVQTVPPLSPPRSRPAPSSEGAVADADRRRDPA